MSYNRSEFNRMIDYAKASRADIANHLIALNVSNLWVPLKDGAIYEARMAYDDGTVELCQARFKHANEKDAFYALYAIPRKVKRIVPGWQKLCVPYSFGFYTKN